MLQNTAVATVDGTAVADLTPYIVDYYLKLPIRLLQQILVQLYLEIRLRLKRLVVLILK